MVKKCFLTAYHRWLSHFRDHYDFKTMKMSREATPANLEVTEKFPKQLTIKKKKHEHIARQV